MTTTAKAYDGCAEHHVSTLEVNRRWAMLEGQPWNERTAMCRCCYGPALNDGYDERGVGQGEMLCSKCRAMTVEATA